MARKDKKARRRPEIPVSSFSDIAFLLIIFFILATTLQQITGVNTEVPSGEKAESETETTPTVQLLNDQILFNEENVGMSGLGKKLAALNLAKKQKEDEKVVLLEAIGAVDYQRYFRTMASISAAGGVIAIVREDTEAK